PLAISLVSSMSKPVYSPFFSKAKGGKGTSAHTVSVPGVARFIPESSELSESPPPPQAVRARPEAASTATTTLERMGFLSSEHRRRDDISGSRAPDHEDVSFGLSERANVRDREPRATGTRRRRSVAGRRRVAAPTSPRRAPRRG